MKTHLGFMTSDGVVPITAMADVADAVAFEEYIATEAAKLDPAIPLQVRRSMVLGMLGDTEQGQEVVIYAHVRPGQAMVDVDNTRTVITTDRYEPTERQREQTRLRWPTCPFPFCDRTSWRRGLHADNDHITEHPAGATTTSNLAPRRAAATIGSRPSPPGPTAASPPTTAGGAIGTRRRLTKLSATAGTMDG